ncbi:MAG: DNA alkylation repair protein [Candidatus Paceibacterota bacterium]
MKGKIVLNKIRLELRKYAYEEKAKILHRFFKTGKGQYGEGDVFIGGTVPQVRGIAKLFSNEISLSDVSSLISNKIHEERLLALVILVLKFEKGSEEEKTKIYNFYLENIEYVNNWDLVDLSAPKIIGAYLFDKDRKILFKLAKSENLWEKRIAILSTFYFIQKKDFIDTLKIAQILLRDKHDLIHKAVGWMLREVGKKSFKKEEKFLLSNYKKMPRTMLRYAIEKFPDARRKGFLTGKF